MKTRIAGLLLAPLLSGAALAQPCNLSIPEVTPLSAFVINGAQATDTRTGLTWKRCLEGQIFSDNATPTVYTDDSCSPGVMVFNWQGALQYADAIPNWRLPNRKELVSIVERSCEAPSANLTLFPALGSVRLWSSSPSVLNPDMAWVTDFSTGTTLPNARANNLSVRLVSGP